MKRIPVIRTAPNEPLRLLHGGDYNPDQWLHDPDVLREDIRLMQLARVNVVSVGIFAWVALEPEEGRFTLDWLDETVERLHKAGVSVFLATPTGARPAWLSATYPEVLRAGPNRVRNLHGARHNHCYTSPAYRERTKIINQELARRYGSHPAVKLWHLSNEYGGECHCPLCQDAFRAWLRDRYHRDLDELNRAWWTAFWSHTYTDWSQIESPAPHGEGGVHGLTLDWKRFVTHQTRDFMRFEIESVREVTTGIPFTTNLMGFYPILDYPKLAKDIDVVSWDSYPRWHAAETPPDMITARTWAATEPVLRDARIASQVATTHDLMRGCKRGTPWLLMESTPSMTNWMTVSKRKRPGLHLASSLLAVAHGSDSVQYFQWRKSRGSSEKYHGAVVDHAGHERTRVFADVTDVGNALEALREVAGTTFPAEVAVIFDQENRWAINDAQGPRNDGRKGYEDTVERHAHALHALGANVDLIDSEQSLDGYKLVIAPLLYMIKPGVAERISSFVEGGGVLVTTYWSGIVNETDLCFLGGFPGPLSDVLGIWSEELDALHPEEENEIVLTEPLAGRSRYTAHEFCDLVHLRGARALASYGADFYAGRPALTVNDFGKGRAWYIASRNEDAFLTDFYGRLVAELDPVRAYPDPPAPGVHVALREADNEDGTTSEYRFVINFAHDPRPAPPLLPHEGVIYRSPGPNTGVEISEGDHADPRRAGDEAPEVHALEAHESVARALIPSYGVEVRRLVRR